MQSEIHAEIYQAMSLKSDGDLLEIWQKNDHVGWRDEVFEVIAGILQERQVELPIQNEAILKEEQRENLELEKGIPMENDEELENQPAFYNPAEALRLDKWLKWISYAIVLVTILTNLNLFPSFQYLFSQLLGASASTAVSILSIGLPLLIIAGNCALMYFAVYALRMIMRILMEMEVKSRNSAAK
jgi:hypothetical protein